MKPTPKPFVITRWLSRPEDLLAWFAHFADKRIPVGIVLLPGKKYRTTNRAHSPQYSVWRYGVEAVGDKTQKSEGITADMRVERAAWGFEKKFRNHKEVLLNGRTGVHKVA